MNHNVKQISRQNPASYDWNKDEYYNRAHLRLRLIAYLLRNYELKNLKVLDVGCGPAILAQLCDIQEGYVGLDVFDRIMKNSNSKLDLRRWSWDDDSPKSLVDGEYFDIIVASGFLEYINSRALFFKEAARALRPGGLLITSMSSPYWWHYLFESLNPLAKRHPRWKRFSRPEELRGLAREAGFKLFSYIPLFRFRKEYPYDRILLRFRRVLKPNEKIKLNLLAQQYIFEFKYVNNV